MAHACQEQGQQLRLLPGAGVQFGIIAPQPQRTEDLQAQRAGTGRRTFAVGPDGVG
ncbi:hypothetical protein ACGFNP_05855 [Nonomuraea sp. NPDC049269]|uniref:hypothetical protein n=1 Tax=Nonomuraea sp. NPDC049269 TaxID=3364349 RepID=UPI00371BCC6E